MEGVKSVSLTLLVVFLAFVSVFYAERDAVEKELQYKQLANGWVSFYPEVFVDENLNSYEKLKNVVSADLVHGRLRPAFFMYASSGYLISPIVHERLSELDERSYSSLMTGDLRIFSKILLGSVAISMVLMSVLIYRFTGTYIYSILPIIFIPLSPSLTENLVQNYIDSQEIPLLLWLTAWLLFYHMCMVCDTRRRIYVFLLFTLSIFFLTLFFFTKETSIVMTGVVIVQVFLLWLSGRMESKEYDQIHGKIIISTALFVFAISALVLVVTTLHKTGYATAYNIDVANIKKSIHKLWVCVSTYSVVNLYTASIIALSFIVLLVRRNSTINGIAVLHHISLFLSVAILMAGLWIIMIPWDPVLTKYTFPSVFLYTFLLCYSLSIIHTLLNDKNMLMAMSLVVLVATVTFFGYARFCDSANLTRRNTYIEANYGTSVIPDIAYDVHAVMQENPGIDGKILIEWQAGKKWKNHVSWGGLHLERWLNVEYRYNIVDSDGTIVRSYSMPKNETTSFRYDDAKASLFLTEKPKHLEKNSFDIVYRAYLANEAPESDFVVGNEKYFLTEKRIEYFPESKFFKGFVIYRYKPLKIKAQEL